MVYLICYLISQKIICCLFNCKGSNIIQLIDVEEISEVIVRLTNKNITGSFNLGNNDYTTIKNTFESFIESIN